MSIITIMSIYIIGIKNKKPPSILKKLSYYIIYIYIMDIMVIMVIMDIMELNYLRSSREGLYAS